MILYARNVNNVTPNMMGRRRSKRLAM